MELLPLLLIVSQFFLPIAMFEMLRYATRGLLGMFLGTVSVSSNFVTGIRSVTYLSYYSVNNVLFE